MNYELVLRQSIEAEGERLGRQTLQKTAQGHLPPLSRFRPCLWRLSASKISVANALKHSDVNMFSACFGSWNDGLSPGGVAAIRKYCMNGSMSSSVSL